MVGNKNGVVLGEQPRALLEEMFTKDFANLLKPLGLRETSRKGVFIINDSPNGATTVVVKTTAPLVSYDDGDRPKVRIDVMVFGYHFPEIYLYAANAAGRIRGKFRGDVMVDLNVI